MIDQQAVYPETYCKFLQQRKVYLSSTRTRMHEKPMQDRLYSRDFITAVALWQNGWREDPEKKAPLASDLLRESRSLPDAAKVVPGRCHRVLLLDKSTISTLFFDGILSESISSWTTDRTLAAKFKNHLRNDQVEIIFSKQPNPFEVVVNIDNMWRDPEFLKCLEAFQL
jgi:hypothetical protein